jgi:hypothetical protein
MSTAMHDERPDTAMRDQLLAACHEAADRLYRAEVALHIAREAQVDAWVAAAYNGLHSAIAAHLAATAELRRTGPAGKSA